MSIKTPVANTDKADVLSLVEVRHSSCPDPADTKAVLDWAHDLLSWFKGGDPNDLPYGAELKYVRLGDEPCPVSHLRRTREEAAQRIRTYLQASSP